MSEYPHGTITAPIGNHVFDLSAMTEETSEFLFYLRSI